MAHGIKYWYQYKDTYGVNTYKVELCLKDYVSTQYSIPGAAKRVEVWKDRGGNAAQEVKARVIKGTEEEFKFLVLPEDAHKYDEIATSNYKDWLIRKYKNTVLEYEGYVKPEHFEHGYVENNVYFIKIVATCGLGDLKGVPFVDSVDEVYTDRVNGLTILKRCIQAAELSELDFRVHLNTYEATLMASTDCALDKVTYDCRRFSETEEGRVVPWKCSEVVAHILKKYNSYIQQINGYYYIVNPWETVSAYHEFDFTTLVGISANPVSEDLTIDVNGYKYRTKGRKTWVRPLKRVEIKFENKNLGDDESTNGDFQLGNTSGHTNIDWDSFTVGLDGSNYYLLCSDGTNTGYEERTFKADAFAIASYEAGDKIAVTYKVRVNEVVFASSGAPYGQGYPYVQTGVQLGSGTIERGTARTINTVDAEWSEITDFYNVYGTGSYTVYFYVTPNAEITSMKYHWDDITFVQQRQADEITYDRVFVYENSDEAFDEHEEIVKFGDSVQVSDVGALKIGVNLTSSWNRYGETDNLPLLDLYGALGILNGFQGFRTAFEVDIIDPDDNIRPHSILIMPELPGQSGTDIPCEIITFEKDQRDAMSIVTVREIPSGDASYTSKEQVLTSIDGKTSGSSSALPSVAPSYWSQVGTGIYTNNNVGIGMVPTGSYDLEVAADGWIGGDLDVVGDIDSSTGVITENGVGFWPLGGAKTIVADVYLNFSEFEAFFTLDNTSAGLRYAGTLNLAAFVDNSIIHKGYADGYILSNPGSTLAKAPTTTEDGYLLSWDFTGGEWDVIDPATISGAPGGSPGDVQWNNAGSFDGFGDWDGQHFEIEADGGSTEVRVSVYNNDTVGGNPGAVMTMFSGQYGEWGLRIGEGTINRIMWGAGGYLNHRSFWNGARWVNTSDSTILIVTDSGQIQMNASTTSDAAMNMPHGATPTTPANGDMWTTTSGLYVQINGSTVGPLSAAGAFLDLTDVDESTYVAHANYLVAVNSTPDGLEFVDPTALDYWKITGTSTLTAGVLIKGEGNTINMEYNDTGDYGSLGITSSAASFAFIDATNSAIYSIGTGQNIYSSGWGVYLVYLSTASGNPYSYIAMESDGIEVLDLVGATGFFYAADYSSSQTKGDRWIPDKGYVDSVSGATTWIDLTDVDEPDYTGHAGELVRVNAIPDGLEFVDPTALDYWKITGTTTLASADVTISQTDGYRLRLGNSFFTSTVGTGLDMSPDVGAGGYYNIYWSAVSVFNEKYANLNFTTHASAVSSTIIFSAKDTSQAANVVSIGGSSGVIGTSSLYQSSGFGKGLTVNANIHQSSTAGYYALYVFVDETSIGSGDQRMIYTYHADHGYSPWYLDTEGNTVQYGFMDSREIAEPATPTSGYGRWYVSTTGKPSFKDDAGVPYDLTEGGGGVLISGTPANNQIAIWTSDDTIEGDSEVTYDGATFAVTTQGKFGPGGGVAGATLLLSENLANILEVHKDSNTEDSEGNIRMMHDNSVGTGVMTGLISSYMSANDAGSVYSYMKLGISDNSVTSYELTLEPDHVYVSTTLGVGASTAVTSGYIMELFGTNNKGRAADWYATSDIRFKDFINPFRNEELLGNISAIKGMLSMYVRTDDPNQNLEIGYIAQDLLPIFPEIIGGSYKEQYDISIKGLASLALEGVAQLREETKNEIDKLKDKVKRLESAIM